MVDIAAIEAALRARLTELAGAIARLEGEQSAPLDADFSEQANELEDRDAWAGIEDTHRTEVSQIHAALNRIAAGSYGTCANCGCAIPAARLEVMPTATSCVACGSS